jgi:hypothetical protein
MFICFLLFLGIKALFDLLRKKMVPLGINLISGSWSSISRINMSTKITYSSIFQDQWPSSKHIFRALFGSKQRLLDATKVKNNAGKHVIVYEASSHMGGLTANLMIKYGYSIILIDPCLQKLQDLKL